MRVGLGIALNIPTLSNAQIIIFLFLLVSVRGVTCPTTSNSFANCQACTLVSSNIVCTACKNAYYLTSASTCALCSSVISLCASCSVSGSSLPTCNTCETNTALYNGVCQACNQITGCSSCSITQNNLICMQCSSGYLLYQSQNQCIKCQIANCSTCSLNLDSTFICSACFSGYYLLNSTYCQPCSSTIQYCTNCNLDSSSVLTCTTCASPLLYIANNTCFANCITIGKPNCVVCRLLTLSTGLAVCSACQPGYYLQPATKNCLACGQASPGCTNCGTVNSSTSCLSCDSGYYLSGSPGICTNCSKVQPLCATCNFSFTLGNGRCTSCVQKYYLNTTDFQCYACSSNPYVNNTLPANSCSACYVNNSMLYCSQCAPKYYASNGSCLLCSSVILNCDQCGSALACSLCAMGYLIIGSSCVSCSVNFANCLYCNSKQCTDCISGYYSNNNKQCIANCSVANCLSCQITNHSQCNSCKTGYILINYTCTIINCTAPLQFNGVICTCPPTRYNSPKGCIDCSDTNCLSCPGGVCDACLQGYYQTAAGGACSPCQIRCRICNATFCFLCDDGFMFFNTSCVVIAPNRINQGVIQVNNLYQLCGFGCVSCNASLDCNSCGRGFVFNGTFCVQCPQNCAACNVNLTAYNKSITENGVVKNQTFYRYDLLCLLCDSAAALLNNSCVKCSDPNCISCDFNPEYCLQCTVKYTPDSAGICSSCLSFCDYCDQSGPGLCDQNSCSIGYTWINQTICLPCVLGCPSCNTTYPFTCLGCLLGTYLSENKTCLSCQLGCYNCSSSSTCLTCHQYYLLTNGTCYPYCQLPCLSCVWSNAQQICKSCLRGYTLASNGSCLANLNCTIQGICEYCPIGYFAYRGRCYLCLGNCDFCTFSPTDPAFVISNINYVPYLNCTKCATGYFLNPSKSSCSLCPDNCQICLSAQNCLICKNGTFVQRLNYNRGVNTFSVGKCEACSTSCLTCSISPNRCTSCADGYNLSSFRCFSAYYIVINITLAVDNPSSEDLTANFKNIQKGLCAALGNPYTSNTALLNLISFKLSSLLITSTASIPNVNESSNIYNSINANLQNTTKIANYPVTSYSLQPVGFTPTNTTTGQNPTNVGLIVGVVIGIILAIVLIIVAVFFYRKMKKQRSEEQAEQQEAQTNPTTSNGILRHTQSLTNDAKEQIAPDLQIKIKPEMSHISETNSRPSQMTQKKHITNIQSVVPSLPRRSNLPQSKSNPHITKFQKSHIPQIESVDPRSLEMKEKSYSPSHYNQQPQTISKYKSRAGKEVSLYPAKVSESKHVSFQKQSKESRVQDSAHIPNESHFQTQTVVHNQEQKEQKKRKKTQSEQKYIPNKNTHFI